MKVLNAKNVIGEEAKQIYEMKYEDIALRYDHTVSLGRYMAMHQDLPLPFKRYYIGKAWRREEPQRLRYREFTQADVDIVGGRNQAANAEVIAVGSTALASLGIDYTVQINDRRFLDDLFETMGVPREMFFQVMRIVDKLEKIGVDGVTEQLQKLNLQRDTISKVVALITYQGTNEDKLGFLEKTLKRKEPLNELRDTLALLDLYKLKQGAVQIEFSLVRGIDYYTGIVFEYRLADKNEKSAIGSGGRYDNLVGTFGNKQLPAVGSSLGIDRILDLLNFSASTRQSYATVFVATIGEKNYPYALDFANAARAQEIGVDLNVATRNISNQLAYANALRFKYAVIIGDSEEKEKKVRVRNLLDGTEKIVSAGEALIMLKEVK
jgi:histidyl-tRNA synthetase